MTFKKLFSSSKLVDVQKEVGDLIDKVTKDTEVDYDGTVLAPDKKNANCSTIRPEDARSLMAWFMYNKSKNAEEFNKTYKSHIDSMTPKGKTLVFTWKS
jgi:hypothetical protein